MKLGQKIIMGLMVILLTTGSPLAWSHPSSDSNFHNWKHTWSRTWSHGWSRAKSHSGWFHNKFGWLKNNNETNTNIGKNPPSQSGALYVVPEIDAASGTRAFALLTGFLLLAGEKSRSKRR
ncbi:hypothetical protein Metal_0347 [Methylomicrobium album BG8]|uniref:PEP-CTERM exosortase interaction domain-containing protein n=2 Tax=Methylomicrobium album TaxID=39775 RepID=H8GM09_METAL|nr:VPEID-CTERM sorting domain-containing protein [Methylomicrobium agile]EIC28205.1 hypothetical protein Metal_0347 [Methylomicrobium album BG8]